MRILTRYIVREVLSYTVLGGVLFTFILFTSRLGQFLEIFVRDSASLGDVARLIAYFLPGTLIVTIPMAVLVGILLGLSRLAADSEITAMRASGMGAFDFVRIISLVSLCALLFGLFNSIYLAPRAAAALLALEGRLKYAQASFAVEPRVFDEDFKNVVLYVQDVRPGAGAALWRHVFLADLAEPASPRITTAEEAIVTQEANSSEPGSLHLRLRNGAEHQIADTDPNQYNIQTFGTADLPMQAGAQEDTHVSRSDTPILALSLAELRRRASLLEGQNSAKGSRAARPYQIELNKRFSYPFACLVLMLVGVPLGLSSKRGGKSTGFVLTILLVFVYYFLSLVGTAMATQGKLTPFLGVWAANVVFAIAGGILLQQLSAGGIALSLVSSIGLKMSAFFAQLSRKHNDPTGSEEPQPHRFRHIAQRIGSTFRIRFPQILDEYIMRTFLSNLGLVLITFWILFTVFTFFELIGDIIRNRTPLVTVGDYLLNLTPFILYHVTPLCVLVAVLTTFGAFTRSSELTAMKAAGISIYRVMLPVLVLCGVIAASLFAFDESYLPYANRRQEALRNIIKGKPPQTFLRPDRKWISGRSYVEVPVGSNRSGSPNSTQGPEPVRIFYYQFFDPDRNVFANLTVFEFDPVTFTLKRRIFATSARWDGRVDRWLFENGWVRTFNREAVVSYEPFILTTFPAIREEPQYFKKEDRQSQEMAFGELSRYIKDLRQSGFDTKKLAVELNLKIAYPVVTLVMAILGMPFAFATGKRGGVAGFAVAIMVAISYQGLSSLFEAMGRVNTLPPSLAAWSPDLLFALAGGYLLLRTPS